MPTAAEHRGFGGTRRGGVQALRRSLGEPSLDLAQPMPYTALQQMTDPGNPPGMNNYWKAGFPDELDDEAIATPAGTTTSSRSGPIPRRTSRRSPGRGGIAAALEPFATGGFYPNFMGEEAQAGWRRPTGRTSTSGSWP